MTSNELKTGDILNTHTPFIWWKIWRYLSVAIRFFEKLRFGQYAWASHTAIAVWSPEGLFVYEADPKVKKTEFSKWCLDKEISITRLPKEYFVNNVVMDIDVFNYCEGRLGEKYDFFGLLLWQPIYILTHKWFGKKINGRVYCSEFVSQILNKFFGLFPDSYQVSPADILEDTINYEIYRGPAKDILK